MCMTFYQIYNHCDCFLIKIKYCALTTKMWEAPCPDGLDRSMTFPFRCGLEECPRQITSLEFEAWMCEEGEKRWNKACSTHIILYGNSPQTCHCAKWAESWVRATKNRGLPIFVYCRSSKDTLTRAQVIIKHVNEHRVLFISMYASPWEIHLACESFQNLLWAGSWSAAIQPWFQAKKGRKEIPFQELGDWHVFLSDFRIVVVWAPL